MYDRLIKNWISTVLGTVIIGVGIYLVATTKIDVPSFVILEGVGAFIAGFKYKK